MAKQKPEKAQEALSLTSLSAEKLEMENQSKIQDQKWTRRGLENCRKERAKSTTGVRLSEFVSQFGSALQPSKQPTSTMNTRYSNPSKSRFHRTKSQSRKTKQTGIDSDNPPTSVCTTYIPTVSRLGTRLGSHDLQIGNKYTIGEKLQIKKILDMQDAIGLK